MQNIVRELEAKRAAAQLGGGPKRIEGQHKKGEADRAGADRAFARTRERLKSGTCSSSIDASTLEWTSRAYRATALSPVMAW